MTIVPRQTKIDYIQCLQIPFYSILDHYILYCNTPFHSVLSTLSYRFSLLFYSFRFYSILFDSELLTLQLILLFVPGICDCCDGSDENNIYKNNICENTCEKDLISRKQSALNLYQNVRDGMKVKREFINSFQLKKATESK